MLAFLFIPFFTTHYSQSISRHMFFLFLYSVAALVLTTCVQAVHIGVLQLIPAGYTGFISVPWHGLKPFGKCLYSIYVTFITGLTFYFLLCAIGSHFKLPFASLKRGISVNLF